MFGNYPLSPFNGRWPGNLGDFDRCHYRVAIKAALYDDIDLSVNIQPDVMEKL